MIINKKRIIKGSDPLMMHLFLCVGSDYHSSSNSSSSKNDSLASPLMMPLVGVGDGPLPGKDSELPPVPQISSVWIIGNAFIEG